VREQQVLFKAGVVLIEDKASGTQLIQELIADGCHALSRYQPTCDKIISEAPTSRSGPPAQSRGAGGMRPWFSLSAPARRLSRSRAARRHRRSPAKRAG
jgi:hypothetical protein